MTGITGTRLEWVMPDRLQQSTARTDVGVVAFPAVQFLTRLAEVFLAKRLLAGVMAFQANGRDRLRE
jgi:hypothetical protein